MGSESLPYKWNDIERELANLRGVSGGFSRAQRGLIKMPDGTELFVKIGLHENTKVWAQKEIWVYRFLKRHNYQHAPNLMAMNKDETGFAIEACTIENGWDWTDSWNEERLSATLNAMSNLANIIPGKKELSYLAAKSISENDDGWAPLMTSSEKQKILIDKLRAIGEEELADGLDFDGEAGKSSKYKFSTNTLVHDDIRSDNCAWNAQLKKVKIVDWNWTQLGDKDIDLGATLTHVQRSGYNLPQSLVERLNPNSLQWLAGFWLNEATTPIWEGGPEYLRDVQLHAGVTALKLQKRARK